ncbi:lysylphosphatidylglycerol synthase domain-containing protein [Nonlabens ponticola]|uniref:Flippase-like domain-containing protein n=1 Tax=Nonlabens ponticola TaxID=2496866 RepID=A0A3S9MUI2_9FLAO|nr:lysylphosphatidylglycerol synthase domain-containing protein [Nonlabens ponticola]AZQ42828.1 hypothetical protein EJ995_00715 [Nonlabens ponticola]
MLGISNKAKHFLFLTLKIAVILLIVTFLVLKWQSQPFSFIDLKIYALSLPIYLWVLLPLLSLSSWLVESLKWQFLVRDFRELRFRESIIQNLTSQATSFLTPLRAGEFATKPFFFQADYRRKVLRAVFTGNVLQMAITVILGVPALIFLLDVPMLWISVCAVVAILLVLIEQRWMNLLRLTNVEFVSIVLLSLGRYLLFASVWLILILNSDIFTTIISVMAAISAMYLVVSILPVLQWMDIIVRLGAAQFFLSMLGVDSAEIVLMVFIVWLTNTLLPTAIGSLILISLRSPKNLLA